VCVVVDLSGRSTEGSFDRTGLPTFETDEGFNSVAASGDEETQDLQASVSLCHFNDR